MTKVFGIPNCDTVKKARKWLEQNGVSYDFHDFRSDGLDETLLLSMQAAVGWEALINKRSTTFRNLNADIKEQLGGKSLNEAVAKATLLANPTLIKRPVLMTNTITTVGFKDAQYQEIFEND